MDAERKLALKAALKNCHDIIDMLQAQNLDLPTLIEASNMLDFVQSTVKREIMLRSLEESRDK
jgi:hypothetical protein